MKKVLNVFLICILYLLVISLISCKKENKKWLNTNIDGIYSKECPSEKDDFYQAINYDRIKNENLSSLSFSAGSVKNVETHVKQTIFNVIKNKESKKFDEELITNLYNMYNNWNYRNKYSISAINSIIEKINFINKIEEFESLFSDSEFRLYFPIKVSVIRDSQSYIPKLQMNFFFNYKTDVYISFYLKILEKCGFSTNSALEIITKANDFEKTYFTSMEIESSKLYSSQIKEKFKNIPILSLLENYGFVTTSGCFFENIEMLRNFDSVFLQENINEIKALMVLKLLFSSVQILDRETLNNYLSFLEECNGNHINATEDDLFFDYLNSTCPDLVGKIWVSNYFSEELKKDIEELSLELVNEFEKKFENLSWLSAGSRYNLLYLLKNTKIIVGYSTLPDYVNLNIGSNLYESTINIINYNKFILSNQCTSDNQYIWNYPPHTYNAYYDGNNNSINICAGYICGIDYDLNDSKEEKLAKLGLIISHELSHLLFCKTNDGNILARFNRNDYENINKKLEQSKNYLNSFYILDSIKCNGENCKFEMSSDIFGMSVLLSLIHNQYSDFDYQKFFTYYARGNFVKYPKNIEMNLSKNDSHPPYFLRTNIVLQQFDEFYNAFSIKKNDGMYLKEKNRIIYE